MKLDLIVNVITISHKFNITKSTLFLTEDSLFQTNIPIFAKYSRL